jgi:hypothetical protein
VRRQRKIRNLTGEMLHLKRHWVLGFRASKHARGKAR